MRVLVMRPGAEAARTARSLMALGHQAIIAPVLALQAIDTPIRAGGYDGLAVTSGATARVLATHPSSADLIEMRAFAVGRRTAEALREIGFAAVASAEGDVTALARLIAARLDEGAHVLHVSGEDRAGDLGAALAPSGITVETLTIYRMVRLEALPEAAHRALSTGEVEAALHYSARTARVTMDLVDQAGLMPAFARLRHHALSEQVAAPLRAAGFDVVVAAHPHEAALLATLSS